MKAEESAIHLEAARAEAIASGAPVTSREASHMLRCGRCRAALARRDASAIVGLLAHAAPPLPPPPLSSIALPARSPWLSFSRRVAFAAAAAGLAAAALYWLAVRPVPPASPSAPAAVVAARRGQGATVPAGSVVRGVDIPGARIVTLLPPTADAPSVTLILGAEIDL